MTNKMTQSHRTKVHQRVITLDGYARDDGLVDVEASLTDIKTYDFPNRERGLIKAHEPLHHMKVCITLNDELTITDAKAETLAAPYKICPAATFNITNLIGLKIASGWRRQVRQAIGGITGCTHITELMGVLATAALQTFYGERARKKRAEGIPDTEANDTSALVNSCIGHAEDGEAVLAEMLSPQKSE